MEYRARIKSDREVADHWATHDSTAYARALRAVAAKVDPALRQRGRRPSIESAMKAEIGRKV